MLSGPNSACILVTPGILVCVLFWLYMRLIPYEPLVMHGH